MINITSHKEFSCQGCNFYSNENELLVVAEYWEGYGNRHFGRALEAMRQEYGESVAKTGVILLGVPTLVMKFTLE